MWGRRRRKAQGVEADVQQARDVGKSIERDIDVLRRLEPEIRNRTEKLVERRAKNHYLEMLFGDTEPRGRHT
jgi:hypothetical protein